ncbi:MAG TPA: tRNA (N6-threonylcarbamoyladenosine(37)-N6)-methyltransferase TrmO [Candidatus Thermoplasmatota archaeon]|nr:tRNA (N6-threonylcarbamoyladenosine(37)-N6)-methyltransferase TrmO [Candidatus Thermoplasmatota archaeon]
MDLTLRPIGLVRSPYKTPLDAPRQGEFAQVEAAVELDARYEEGLEGVASGDRLLVLWWAHEADRHLLARPGTDGVFRMRTPHRPNPICLSEVEVVRREGARLLVRGLEAIDGTPVLDLKSARAEYDGWTSLPTRVD